MLTVITSANCSEPRQEQPAQIKSGMDVSGLCQQSSRWGPGVRNSQLWFPENPLNLMEYWQQSIIIDERGPKVELALAK